MPEIETDVAGSSRPRSRVLNWIATIVAVFLVLGLFGECAFVFVLDKPDHARWEKARSDMGQIQQALNRYALIHGGSYPPNLAPLTPTYFPSEVPKDPFTKTDYSYKRTSDGFTLTCLGKDSEPGGAAIPDRDIIFDETSQR